MLYIYKEIKEVLDTIAGIKLVEWYNNQYDGTIHAEPVLFVEFLNAVKLDSLNAYEQMGTLTVRVHQVRKMVVRSDKTIQEEVIAGQEEVNEAIYRLLHKRDVVRDDGSVAMGAMERKAFEHHHYLQGWCVTTQDFEGLLFTKTDAKVRIKADAVIKCN